MLAALSPNSHSCAQDQIDLVAAIAPLDLPADHKRSPNSRSRNNSKAILAPPAVLNRWCKIGRTKSLSSPHNRSTGTGNLNSVVPLNAPADSQPPDLYNEEPSSQSLHQSAALSPDDPQLLTVPLQKHPKGDSLKSLAKRAWSSSPSSSRSASPSRDEDSYTVSSSVSVHSTFSKFPTPTSGLSRAYNTIKGAAIIDRKCTASVDKTKRLSADSHSSSETRSLCEEYRALDTELERFVHLAALFNTRFSLKSAQQRVYMIRACLIHTIQLTKPASSTEEMIVRLDILVKWWSVLLTSVEQNQENEMNGHVLSAADRAVFLDGILAVIETSEWRTLSDREDLAEKVLELYRNYRHNLCQTLSYAIEHLNRKAISAPVTAFCGKILAFSFYHIEGVALYLLQALHISKGTLIRLKGEVQPTLPKEDDSSLMAFPKHLRGLILTSLNTYHTYSSQIAISTIHSGDELAINLHGPWLRRWRAPDSDIFYAFLQQYHLLVAKALPPGFPYISSPGYLHIQSHLLSVLDALIHRHHSATNPHLPPPEPRFANRCVPLDIQGSQDSIRTMSILMTGGGGRPNAVERAGKKLNDGIRLSLESVCQLSPVHSSGFAEIFHAVLRAAAKRTSLWDAEGCFTLCDLSENLLGILVHYHQIQWDFWIDVIKAMFKSENCVTEVRALGFIYVLWSIWNQPMRKHASLWLLDSSVWDRMFVHWSSMVRCYFMILVCWRIIRLEDENEDGSLESEVIALLRFRLHTLRNHHIRLVNEALAFQAVPPTLEPLTPAPRKRLTIVPSPNSSLADHFLTSFDNMVPSSTAEPFTPSLEVEDDINSLSSKPIETLGGALKRRWDRLRNAVFRGDDEDDDPDFGDADTMEMDKRASQKSPYYNINSYRPTGPRPTFKFSLEPIAPRFPWETHHLGPSWHSSGVRVIDGRLLPTFAEEFFLSHKNVSMTDLGKLYKTGDHSIIRANVVGRALAEWAVIIGDCERFFARRRYEGVTEHRLVETPRISIDWPKYFTA